MIDAIIVAILVIAAAVYLLRTLVQQRGGSCGGGCRCSGSEPARDDQQTAGARRPGPR